MCIANLRPRYFTKQLDEFFAVHNLPLFGLKKRSDFFANQTIPNIHAQNGMLIPNSFGLHKVPYHTIQQLDPLSQVTALYLLCQPAVTRGTYALATIPTEDDIVSPYKIAANSKPDPRDTQATPGTPHAQR